MIQPDMWGIFGNLGIATRIWNNLNNVWLHNRWGQTEEAEEGSLITVMCIFHII